MIVFIYCQENGYNVIKTTIFTILLVLQYRIEIIVIVKIEFETLVEVFVFGLP